MKINRSFIKLLALHLSLMLVVAVSLLLLFFQFALPAITHHGETITVPSLKGHALAEAQKHLAERSLCWKVTEDFAYAPDYPPGVVMQQYPRAGTRVKQSRKVYLTLNAANAPKVAMPDLVDGSVRNAHMLLKSQGLLLGDIKYIPDIAENAVLEQWHDGTQLAPGSLVAKGASIDLVVGAGLGKHKVTVPQVTGMKLEDAQLFLLSAGIKLGSITHQAAEDQSTSSVLRQVPEAGQRVRIGETVDLWLVAAHDEEEAPTAHDAPILPKRD